MNTFHFYFLYIDPGTGSMLFSILIGAAATLYFLFRALIIKFRTLLSGGRADKKDDTEFSFVIYNEHKRYWNVFEPVVNEFEKRKIGLLYLASSEDDPVFARDNRHITVRFIGEGNRAWSRLNFLNAALVLMTTPGLDVYQLKRSKTVKHYSHILHMPSDATLYRLFGIDYFDSVLLSGDYQKADIRALEKLRGLPEKQLVTVGCTYLDVYAEEIKKLEIKEIHPFTVLVSPSWGKSALLSRFGEKLIKPLAESGWRIIIRPHPQSKVSEASVLEKLANLFAGYGNIVWDYETNNIYSLSKSDLMISDFSGIIFDYIFLFNRPVMYVNQGFDKRPYDADDLDHELWQFSVLKEIGLELREEDFPSIVDIIKKAPADKSLEEGRIRAKSTAWQHPGEAGKRCADFMIETVNGLQAQK
jgi:hypothetical protein